MTGVDSQNVLEIPIFDVWRNYTINRNKTTNHFKIACVALAWRLRVEPFSSFLEYRLTAECETLGEKTWPKRVLYHKNTWYLGPFCVEENTKNTPKNHRIIGRNKNILCLYSFYFFFFFFQPKRFYFFLLLFLMTKTFGLFVYQAFSNVFFQNRNSKI